MSVTVHRRGGLTVARISGEMDLSTADEIRKVLDQEIDRGCAHMLLGLRKVTFMDSSGLGVILGRYRRLDALGARMTLVGVSDQVRPLLDLSGLLKLLPVVDDESEVGSGG